MSSNEIISICQQLSSEGKQPSVALIKARLANKQPLPSIIAGLKQWQANPNAKVEERSVEAESATTLPLEQRVAQLEAEVLELKSVIKQLQAEFEK